MRVRLQAALFGDFSRIETGTVNALRVAVEVNRAGFEFLPRTLQELSAGDGTIAQRLQFIDARSGATIALGGQRIDILLEPKNGFASRDEGLDQFARLVETALTSLDANLQATQIAFVITGTHFDLPLQQVEQVYREKITSQGIYTPEQTHRWFLRRSAFTDVEFNTRSATCNLVTTLQRSQGQKVEFGMPVRDIDGLLYEVDCNTDEIQKDRPYVRDDLIAFMRAVEPILSDIEGMMTP